MSAQGSFRKRPFLTTALIHASLVVICLVTLYPVLWVVKLALTPADNLSLSASPLPDMAVISACADEKLAAGSTGGHSALMLECSLTNFKAVLGTTDAKGR